MTERWRADAACNGLDPDLFFVADYYGMYPEAMETCARCPVRDECLEDELTTALSPNHIWGVRAGLPEHERRKLWRRRYGNRPRGYVPWTAERNANRKESA